MHEEQTKKFQRKMASADSAGEGPAGSAQKSRQALRRSAKFLARDEMRNLAREAREALFPSHESEVGLARNTPHIVHGVVSERARTDAKETGGCSPLFRRRQRSMHKAGVRFREPSLPLTRKPSPPGTLGKRKKQNLTVALPHTAGARQGSLSARWDGAVQPTPTSALAQTMNRALRLKGPEAGATSPINKHLTRKSPKTSATAHGELDVFRYLGDLARSSREGGGTHQDQFLLDLYGIDNGGFVAGADVTPDAARVLGKLLGFAGDMIRPSSLLAQACFACSSGQDSDGEDRKSKGNWVSLEAPGLLLEGRGRNLREHLNVWERELKMMLQSACCDFEKMIQDLHLWPTWYVDMSESDRKTTCGLLSGCDRDFRLTFDSLHSRDSSEKQDTRFQGFLGKAPGLGGQALTDSDIHKLMNAEHLGAAVESLFYDLLKEATANLERLSGGGKEVAAPFPVLRRGDWAALQRLGPAIEAVRKEIRDSRRRLQILTSRKADVAIGRVQKADQASTQWGKGKAKMLPMMKLGLIMGQQKSRVLAEEMFCNVGPESLLACTLKASLSDGIKVAASGAEACSHRSDGVKACEARLERRGAVSREKPLDAMQVTQKLQRSSRMGAALLSHSEAISNKNAAQEAESDGSVGIDLHEMAAMAPPGFLEDYLWGSRDGQEDEEQLEVPEQTQQMIIGGREGRGSRPQTRESFSAPGSPDAARGSFRALMSEEAQAAASPRRFSARCGDACRDVTGDSIFQRGPRVHWQDGVQRSGGAIKVFTGKGGKFVEEKGSVSSGENLDHAWGVHISAGSFLPVNEATSARGPGRGAISKISPRTPSLNLPATGSIASRRWPLSARERPSGGGRPETAALAQPLSARGTRQDLRGRQVPLERGGRTYLPSGPPPRHPVGTSRARGDGTRRAQWKDGKVGGAEDVGGADCQPTRRTTLPDLRVGSRGQEPGDDPSDALLSPTKRQRLRSCVPGF